MCQLGLDQGDPGARRQRRGRVRKGNDGHPDAFGLKHLVQCWVGPGGVLGRGAFRCNVQERGVGFFWQAAQKQLKTLNS